MEPLEPEFTGAALHAKARGRRVAVKQFLMDGGIVTGVGNIYASEALLPRGHPSAAKRRPHLARALGRSSPSAVRVTLERALAAGGTHAARLRFRRRTSRIFPASSHAVYGREGKPCRVCKTPIRALRQGQRSTFYCPACQR